MYKNFVLCLMMIIFSTSVAWSDLMIEVLDFQSGKVRMTYEITDSMTGNQQFRFPGEGFIHDETQGDFVVESVFDTTNNYELQYSVQKIGEQKLPQLKINYQEPIPAGGKKNLKIQVVLNLPIDNVYYENGRYFLEYETSHEFTYKLSMNHYLVFTNQPVKVYEQAGTIYAEEPSEKLRNIKIATRAMETKPEPLFGN